MLSLFENYPGIQTPVDAAIQSFSADKGFFNPKNRDNRGVEYNHEVGIITFWHRQHFLEIRVGDQEMDISLLRRLFLYPSVYSSEVIVSEREKRIRILPKFNLILGHKLSIVSNLGQAEIDLNEDDGFGDRSLVFGLFDVNGEPLTRGQIYDSLSAKMTKIWDLHLGLEMPSLERIEDVVIKGSLPAEVFLRPTR